MVMVMPPSILPKTPPLVLKHMLEMPSFVPLGPLGRGLSRLVLGPEARVYLLDLGIGVPDLVAEIHRHTEAEIVCGLPPMPDAEEFYAKLRARVAVVTPSARIGLPTSEPQLYDAAISFTASMGFGGIPGLLRFLAPRVRPGGWFFLAHPYAPIEANPSGEPTASAAERGEIDEATKAVSATLVDAWTSTREDFLEVMRLGLERTNQFINENAGEVEGEGYLKQLEAARAAYQVPDPNLPVPTYGFYLFRRDEEGSKA